MFTIKEEQMMCAITEHKDFGKRNPVDIGIECGYSETEILDMIQKISEQEEMEEENEKIERRKYYFLIKYPEENAKIVSVDIENWEIKFVKEVENYKYIGGKFRIKDNYFVYLEADMEYSFWLQKGSKKILCWENLETGEKSKLLLDSNIINFDFWNENIFVLTEDELLLWDTDRIIKKCEKDGCISGETIVATENRLYLIDRVTIYEVNANLSYRKLWNGYDKANGYRIGAVEYIDNELVWYMYKDNAAYSFTDTKWSYRKYRESRQNDYSTDSEGFSLKVGIASDILNGTFTEHYRLLQKEIRSIDNKKKICDFPRNVDSLSNQGQVISIPDKDVFIGVTTVGERIGEGIRIGGETAILKIDLQNEKEAKILPIEF